MEMGVVAKPAMQFSSRILGENCRRAILVIVNMHNMVSSSGILGTWLDGRVRLNCMKI